MPFCAPWRKPQAESRPLSEIYKPPVGRLTKDVLVGEGGTRDGVLKNSCSTHSSPNCPLKAEIGEHLRTLPNRPAKEGLKGVALRTLEQLRRACDFCTQTSAEQEAALQMALGGFSCY
ncbi:hypothetical protein XELAEV_18028810mg [Xenopus laevis]|uniref:Uncharacterized protein n=1 Tax=Xenopus laevis TaxID=8355 RepID=A0A974HHJ2_XENLA|nr:hypothetical protein XELAEV_18028810mg [Xenopus laevis]